MERKVAGQIILISRTPDNGFDGLPFAHTSTHQISVIIPCHNQAQYLTESILSVLEQTIEPCEIIIVDDGSTDNTEQVATSFPQVKYVYQEHKGNHTPARAMNKGIILSKGDYIVCLASDDKIAPEYLESCLAEFCRTDIGIVSTGCQEFGASNKIRIPRKLHHRFSVLREPGGQIGAMMVRREVYMDCFECDRDCFNGYEEMQEYLLKYPPWVGGYDESLHSLEDWDFFIRAGLTGWKIKSIPHPIHYARVHDGRVTAHFDVSELHRRYIFMKEYAYASRVFDATVLLFLHPLVFAHRLRGKLHL